MFILNIHGGSPVSTVALSLNFLTSYKIDHLLNKVSQKRYESATVHIESNHDPERLQRHNVA